MNQAAVSGSTTPVTAGAMAILGTTGVAVCSARPSKLC